MSGLNEAFLLFEYVNMNIKKALSGAWFYPG